MGAILNAKLTLLSTAYAKKFSGNTSEAIQIEQTKIYEKYKVGDEDIIKLSVLHEIQTFRQLKAMGRLR